MVSISKKAQEEILKSLSSSDFPSDYHLRLGVKGGSCSAKYIIGFDKKSENDEVFNVSSIDLIIDKRHLLFLVGVNVDFQENNFESGFVITK